MQKTLQEYQIVSGRQQYLFAAAAYKWVRPTEQKKHLIQSKLNMGEWKSWNHELPLFCSFGLFRFFYTG